MNGCAIKGTPIAVDFWKPSKAPEARLFFLTHLHADHTQGLTQTWRLPIFTSPINALLLEHTFKLPRSIIRELEVGETYLIPLDDEGNYPISVTVLDANHVPGSVMFLFQGYFGNILYCGDMRWYPELLENQVLKSVVDLRELDVLYLDNTFSAPYCVFPSRKDAKQEVFKIIDTYADHVIKLGIRDLGREELLEAIARRFQERILVNQTKFEMLQVLNKADVFTTNPKEARIHAVPMNQMQVAAHKRWNEECQTVSIILTALFVGWPNGPYSSQQNNGIFVVPYSDHSSYSELMEMVGKLAPHCVTPIVRKWSKSGWWSDPNAPDQSVKGDMSVYNHCLTFPPPKPICVPYSVAKLMEVGAPMLLSHQPRRCKLRHGLSPRPGRTRGVVFSSPELPSLSPAPPSSVTLDISISDTPTSHHVYPFNPSSAPSNTSQFSSNTVSGIPVQLNEQSPCKRIRTDEMLRKKHLQVVKHPALRSCYSPGTGTSCPALGGLSSGKCYNQQDLSEEMFRGQMLRNDLPSTLRQGTSSAWIMSQNINEDILNRRSVLEEKRCFHLNYTSALISSQCAILNCNDENAKNDISGLIKNAEDICSALDVVKSLF